MIHRFLGKRTLSAAFLVVSIALLVPRPALAGDHNLLALGDSFAYGYTQSYPITPIGYGDQGYVKPFADFLATQFGGVRPTVTNLGIPGESSSSLFTASQAVLNLSPLVVDAPARTPAFNLNYASDFQPQINTAVADILAIHAAGGTVDDVTIQIGGNDFLGLLLQPNFALLDPATQNALFNSQATTLFYNDAALLYTIKTYAPEANIFSLGYYDPFQGLHEAGLPDPLYGISGPLTLLANSEIATVADIFGAKYIDIFTPFVGHELEYSNILTLDGGFPNPHPNALGYQVIANQLIIAAVPEPGVVTFGLLAGGSVLALITRRRKS